MATSAAHGPTSSGSPAFPSASMTPTKAIRLAWVIWVILLVLPFLMFLRVVWYVSTSQPTAALPSQSSEYWFLTASAYLLVVVTGSFFARSWVFKAYWTGQPVSPGKYLSGMLTVWLSLEIGGFFSLAGCVANNSLLPNLFPALIAFMFFATFWPSGRAMVRPAGQHEDPEMYEEPR